MGLLRIVYAKLFLYDPNYKMEKCHMKKHSKHLLVVLVSLAIMILGSCKPGGSGSGSSGEAPTEPDGGLTQSQTGEVITQFVVSDEAKTGIESKLHMIIKSEDNSPIFYKIDEAESDGKNFKPSSGIIVPKNKQGTLTATLSPDQPETNNYTLTLTNSQNQKTVKTFSIQISNP